MAAFRVKQAMYNSLESAYSAAFSKIFGSYDKFVIRNCQFYSGVLPFCYKMDISRLKFYANLRITDNISVRTLFNWCGSQEFSELLSKYHLFANDSSSTWKKQIWNAFSETIVV